MSQRSLVNSLIQQNAIRTPKVIEAMRKVDRINYCPINPYEERPQCTSDGQTISAPQMHGHALELLAPCLEVTLRCHCYYHIHNTNTKIYQIFIYVYILCLYSTVLELWM